MKGVYPDVDGYSALVQPSSYDSLEPTFRAYPERIALIVGCPRAVQIQGKNEGKGTPWANHLDRTKALRRRSNAVSGIEENDSAGWSSSWDQ